LANRTVFSVVEEKKGLSRARCDSDSGLDRSKKRRCCLPM